MNELSALVAPMRKGSAFYGGADLLPVATRSEERLADAADNALADRAGADDRHAVPENTPSGPHGEAAS